MAAGPGASYETSLGGSQLLTCTHTPPWAVGIRQAEERQGFGEGRASGLSWAHSPTRESHFWSRMAPGQTLGEGSACQRQVRRPLLVPAPPPQAWGPCPPTQCSQQLQAETPGDFFFFFFFAEPLGQLLVPRAPTYADWLGRAEPGHTTTGADPGTDALTWTEVPKGMQTT